MHINRVGLFTLSVLAACNVSRDTTAPSARERTTAEAGRAVRVEASCGLTVVDDLRLENDLTCAGDGLTVTGTGIKINLNGHTISGPGSTNLGIRVLSSQDVTIHGGTIRGFLRGINVVNSAGIVIKDNEIMLNATGVLLEGSSGNAIKANVARLNSARAFMLRPNLAGEVSTNNDVVDNVLIDNPTGIYLIRQPGNTFTGNTISGSTVAAIDLDPAPLGASGNVFKGNLLMASGAGIRFSAGWTGNTVLGNAIQSNVCAFKGPVSGNTLQGNTLIANATDFCP